MRSGDDDDATSVFDYSTWTYPSSVKPSTSPQQAQSQHNHPVSSFRASSSSSTSYPLPPGSPSMKHSSSYNTKQSNLLLQSSTQSDVVPPLVVVDAAIDYSNWSYPSAQSTRQKESEVQSSHSQSVFSATGMSVSLQRKEQEEKSAAERVSSEPVAPGVDSYAAANAFGQWTYPRGVNR